MKNIRDHYLNYGLKYSLAIGMSCVLLTATLSAETAAFWHSMLPGARQSLSISDLPDKIFGAKLEIVSGSAPVVDTNDETTKAISEKVGALKITGLVWSDRPDEKRVLIGDFVMREGQSIPSYVFNDGKYYFLTEITKTHLRFKLQDQDPKNSIAFNVSFGLKDTIKNESNASSQSNGK